MNPPIKRWHWLCLITAGLFYVVFIWKNSFFFGGVRCFSLFDDGMISMRYAKNLADGFGLRWNPGEPPVEGYTNLLWTLYLALIHLLPIAIYKTSLVVMLSGVVILIANMLVTKRIAELVAGENSYAPLASMVLTAFYYPLIYWTLRGMEVGFLCLLVNYAVLCAMRLHDKYSTGNVLGLTLALAAALLTRPDMVVPIGVIGLFLIFVISKSGFKLGFLLTPLIIGAVMVGLTMFRMKYYGEPVPNTYYLKVTGVTLWERIDRGIIVLAELFAYHLWPVLVLLLVGLWANPQIRWNPKVILLLGLFFGQSVYSVYVGGDAWEWMNFSNRYVCIALPALFVVFSTIVCNADVSQIKKLSLAVPFLGVGLFIQSYYYVKIKPEKLAAASLIAVGLFVLLAGGWVWLRNRKSQIPAPFFASIVILIACLTLNFFGTSNWIFQKNNGLLIKLDAVASRHGMMLNKATTPDITIAYVWAGATPYFAGRKAIDLLGKSDPVIAKGKPATKFFPGHNKWNYSYSVGQLKPDLVEALWEPTDTDLSNMTAWGYEPCLGRSYLRLASTNKVNLAVLGGPDQ